MDGRGELDLPRREVGVGVPRQLVRQDEKAVERSPKLVRHVREELGFVFRREGELARLLLERLTRLFDLAVLALDLYVLLRQEPCLIAELGIGLAKLFLLALELAR